MIICYKQKDGARSGNKILKKYSLNSKDSNMTVEIVSFDGQFRFENIIDAAKACYLCGKYNIIIESLIDLKDVSILDVKIPKKDLLKFCNIWIKHRNEKF